MGYYTFYELSVQNADTGTDISKEEEVEIIKFLNPLTEWWDEDTLPTLLKSQSPLDWYISDETKKWYEAPKHMVKLGQAFPNYVFCLEGTGEDRDDVWRFYVWGDKTQYAPGKVIFEDEPDWAYC